MVLVWGWRLPMRIKNKNRTNLSSSSPLPCLCSLNSVNSRCNTCRRLGVNKLYINKHLPRVNKLYINNRPSRLFILEHNIIIRRNELTIYPAICPLNFSFCQRIILNKMCCLLLCAACAGCVGYASGKQKTDADQKTQTVVVQPPPEQQPVVTPIPGFPLLL